MIESQVMEGAESAMIIHVFILREKTQPSEKEADNILAQSKIMLHRLISGIAYEEFQSGNRSYKLSVANPNVKGKLRDLMPLFIKSQSSIYLDNPEKYQVLIEEGIDLQTNEPFCLAVIEKII